MQAFLHRLHDAYCICTTAYCVYSHNVNMSDDDDEDYYYVKFERRHEEEENNVTEHASDTARGASSNANSTNGNGHSTTDNGKRKRVQDKAGAGMEETASGQSVNGEGFEREKPWAPDAFEGHHCPICLGLAEESAMIESCRHIYCKTCLFEWLAVSDRCPLCKNHVTRVLHDIKSSKEFKVHVHGGVNYEGKRNNGSSTSSGDTSAAGVSSTEGEGGAGGASGIDGVRARGGGIRGAEFRSVVYKRSLQADPPEPRARRAKALSQATTWIARDIPAALPVSADGNGSGRGVDARLVVDVVQALLRENDVDEQEGYCKVKEQLRGFLFENTDAFLHELWCFRWSKLGMTAYDRDTTYSARP